MTTWKQFTGEAPDLAAAVRARFEARIHHVLATLRRDGSPRVSGTEVDFGDPDLMLGSMSGALKAVDLRRDPRCALHVNPGDGSMTGGDAKISGRAIEILLPGPDVASVPGESHLFRVELTEVVLTSIADDREHLLIESWHPGAPPVCRLRR